MERIFMYVWKAWSLVHTIGILFMSVLIMLDSLGMAYYAGLYLLTTCITIVYKIKYPNFVPQIYFLAVYVLTTPCIVFTPLSGGDYELNNGSPDFGNLTEYGLATRDPDLIPIIIGVFGALGIMLGQGFFAVSYFIELLVIVWFIYMYVVFITQINVKDELQG